MDENTVALLALVTGGIELRIAVRRYAQRARKVEARVYALEIGRALPDIGRSGETTPLMVPAIRQPERRGHQLGLWLVVGFLALLGLGGCTQAQVDRAQAIVADATAREAQAEHAVELATQAVAKADELAKQVGSVQAEHVVAQAQSALNAAVAARDVAKVAVTGAQQAADAASAAQQAGGSTWAVLAGAAGALLPGVPALLAALGRARAASNAFAQTVKGLDTARASMGDALWTQHVAPALASAQDAAVKSQVVQVQAAASAAGA